jgi:hypothetical protein
MADELKTIEAGPYTLVARLHKGAYRGALWCGGKMAQEVQGTSIDDVWRRLTDALYERQVSVALTRNGAEPSAEEAIMAFRRIEPRLSPGHRAMLRAHLRANGQNITATQLAEAAGYASYSAANLQYGLLGAMLFAEMPERLPQRADGTPIMTCAIALGEDQRSASEEQWIWKMRPHIVAGLTAVNIFK